MVASVETDEHVVAGSGLLRIDGDCFMLLDEHLHEFGVLLSRQFGRTGQTKIARVAQIESTILERGLGDRRLRRR